MQMPGRSTNTDKYRYGYNGMEKDKELKGEGNSYTTEFRQYDPRLGRWLSLDPLMAQFPWMSPYVAFDNNPILLTDPSGLAPANGNDPGKHKVKSGETLWSVSKAYYNKHKKEIGTTWEKYWKDVQGWNKGGNYGKVGGTMVLTKPTASTKSEKPTVDLAKYEKSIKRLESLNKNVNDDDKVDFLVLGASAEVSAATYEAGVEIKNIWVYEDSDNIHVHNSGRFYLTYGLNYGKGASGALAEAGIGAQGGYGFMTNVHPHDDLGKIFEDATDVEISFSKDDFSAGVVISKSEGKNGVVMIYLFFGEYSKGIETNTKMPLKIPVGVSGGVYGKELKRTIIKKVNAADSGKAIINNPRNNLPSLSRGAIQRMDKILMKK
jgi:RHS repeat-associated protein